MGIYFSLLFGLLTSEMFFLLLVTLPLNYKIRKMVYNRYESLIGNSNFITVSVIVSVLVGLLFFDSLKRSQVHITPAHEYDSPSGITPVTILATRAYNQRNVYISGFILYFGVCIVTVMTILKKLVKYETLIRENKSATSESKPQSEYAQLLSQLNKKNIELEGITTQTKNFEKFYDEKINVQ